MKKSHILFVFYLCLFFTMISCSKDEDLVPLEGTWQATSILYDNEYDFNNDGVFTRDLLEEYPCAYEERITLNDDGSGKRFLTSPITWTLSPELKYECAPGFDVERELTWNFDQSKSELYNLMSYGGIFRYERVGNTLIYKIPTNTIRQIATGDTSARDTLRFVFEKLQ